MSAEIQDTVVRNEGCATASMGPRSNERGNMKNAKRRKLAASLLQWGRAQMSAEIIDSCRQCSQTYAASMGPRSNERGNAADDALAAEEIPCFNGAALK